MPATQDPVVTWGTFSEHYRNSYCNTGCISYAIFNLGLAIGLGFFIWRFLYLDTIILHYTEQCYDPVENCVVFNATDIGTNFCNDFTRYKYQLPDLDNIFAATINVPREYCNVPAPKLFDVGLRTCFISNGLCPDDTIFCATGGPPCTSLLGSTSRINDWTIVYGLICIPALCVLSSTPPLLSEWMKDTFTYVSLLLFRRRRFKNTQAVEEAVEETVEAPSL